MNSASERSPAEEWSKNADQLRRVNRDIRSVELRIAQGETVDQSGEEYEVDLRRYLDSLQAERAEIEQAMASQTAEIAPEPSKGQWRLRGRSETEIKQQLARARGFEEAGQQLAQENPSMGNQAIYLVMQEVAPLIRLGHIPVPKDFWDRQVLSKPGHDIDGTQAQPHKPKGKKADKVAERIRARRDFDPDEWDPQERYERGELPEEARRTHEKLIPYPQNGYDTANQQGNSHVTNPESNQPEQENQPERSRSEILAESLRRAAELDTESADVYQPPSSPLNTQNRDRQPQGYNERATDFARKLHEIEDARREQAGERVRAGNVDTFDETREQLAPGEFRAGNEIFRVGERVYYTENDGDRAEHVIMGPSESEPPGLVLKNWAENRQFFVDPENIAARVERIGESSEAPPETSDTPEQNREGGEQFIPEDLLERIPKEPTREDILRGSASLREGLDARINGVAQAKEEREKLFYVGGKKRKEALAQSTDDLEQAYAQYMDNWAARLAVYRGVGDEIREAKTGLQADLAEREASLARIEADQDLSPATKERRIEQKRQAIAETRAAIAECDRRVESLDATLELVMHEAEIEMTLEMAQARTKIESAQAELKEGKLSQKFKNWWRGHPKTRLAIGVGLGIGGLALGGIPGVAMMAGAAAMRGVGGYMGTEAGWNLQRRFRANRSDRKSAEAAAAETSEGAKMQAAAKTEYLQSSNPEMSDQTKADLDLFMQRHASELYSQQAIQKILRGESEASAEVASMLVGDQLGRVNKDASSNRHAKVAGAIVGTGAAALGLWRTLDHGGAKPTPPQTPKEPYSPDYYRYQGLGTARPEAQAQFAEQMSKVPAGFRDAAMDRFDATYLSATKGMSRVQLEALDRAIGRFSTTPGLGNEWTQQNMELLVNQVKNGATANQLISKYGAGPEIPGFN